MILGFRDQFVPYVLDGSKTHTVRAGQRWRDGMRADLFAKVRQKGMRLLFRAPVVRVEDKLDEMQPFYGQIVHWDYAQRYVPCGDCGRSHPLGPCNGMFRSDWRLPRPTRAAMAAR